MGADRGISDSRFDLSRAESSHLQISSSRDVLGVGTGPKPNKCRMVLFGFRLCPAPACMALACMQYRTSFVLSDQRYPPTRADNELDQARRHGLGGVDRVKAVAVRTRGCPSHIILNLHNRQGRLQQVSANASYLPVSLTSSSDSLSTHTLSFCIEIPLMAPWSA